MDLDLDLDMDMDNALLQSLYSDYYAAAWNVSKAGVQKWGKNVIKKMQLDC